MLGALQKFTLSILVFALMLILGSCSDKTQVIGPPQPKFQPGDVNINGIANEVADAVLFSNYFVYGLTVFTIERESQIATTDVNRDGLNLTVADLVHLSRIVIGDALPYSIITPLEVSYTYDERRGVLKVLDDVRIGAVLVVVAGNRSIQRMTDNMDIEYAYDGKNTRILLWSYHGDWFTGDFLEVYGEVVSLEMATYEGQPVNASLLQTEFVLGQNSPDPFSNETVIPFAIPFASNVRFRITNDSGQVVYDFSQYYLAGISSFTWNGTNNYQLAVPDGIYYCTMFFEGHRKYIEMLLKR